MLEMPLILMFPPVICAPKTLSNDWQICLDEASHTSITFFVNISLS